MRVYHFISEKWGLQNIRKGRIKLARLNELNDPFELTVASSESGDHAKVKAIKNHLHQDVGLLCFSRRFDDPVQWAHYADNHRGICLGFDVSAELMSVRYQEAPISIDENALSRQNKNRIQLIKEVLSTKYLHWQYEHEERLFSTLAPELQDENGLYFLAFSSEVRLKEVILGYRSTMSVETLKQALGPRFGEVEIFAVEPAQGNYRMEKKLL